jgi:hypothetical protein
LHDDCWRAGQRPVPSQKACAVETPALQAAVRHSIETPGYAQASRREPSQAPAQLVPSLLQAGRPPRGSPRTAVQVPALPATLQASHWPAQALLQQTPSTQLPLAHWTAAPQEPPFATRGTQTPAEHQSPETQLELLAQTPRQADAPQT